MSVPPDRSPELPAPQPISLHELTEAFAQAMGYSETAIAPAEGGEPVVESGAPEGIDTPPELEASEPAQDACPISPTTILEAMLFVGGPSGQALAPQRAAELMRGVGPAEIPGLIEALNRRYRQRGCPYHIVSEGPGYRLTLEERFHGLRDRFYGKIREARLSQAAIDVLALVAYRQPVAADEVSRLRGRPSGRLLTQLVRRGLLRIDRSAENPKTSRYATTSRFLQLFALEGLADLPQSEDLDRQ